MLVSTSTRKDQQVYNDTVPFEAQQNKKKGQPFNFGCLFLFYVKTNDLKTKEYDYGT